MPKKDQNQAIADRDGVINQQNCTFNLQLYDWCYLSRDSEQVAPGSSVHSDICNLFRSQPVKK